MSIQLNRKNFVHYNILGEKGWLETHTKIKGQNAPYKKTITYPNGTKIITHEYQNGLRVAKMKDNLNTWNVIHISKNSDIIYNNPITNIFGIKNFILNGSALNKHAKSLPKTLKKFLAKFII